MEDTLQDLKDALEGGTAIDVDERIAKILEQAPSYLKTVFCSKDSYDNDSGEYSPIHGAAYFGHSGVLQMLVQKYGFPVDCTLTKESGSASLTPLHCSVISGQVACVRVLLDIGADPNRELVQNSVARTALHEAAKDGNREIVRLLVNAGADVRAGGDTDSTGRCYTLAERSGNPADWARTEGKTQTVHLLEELEQQAVMGVPPTYGFSAPLVFVLEFVCEINFTKDLNTIKATFQVPEDRMFQLHNKNEVDAAIEKILKCSSDSRTHDGLLVFVMGNATIIEF